MNRNQQAVIEYLLEENRTLKQQFESTGKKLRLNNHQRRELAKRGKEMDWQDLQEYATIVRPSTILAWHRKLVALKYTAKRKTNTARQERMAVIRELCVKFAEENQGWGYGRIQGALSNVGYDISMTTVGNILRAKGIIPSPERAKRSNWKTFVRSHLDVMSVADFFCVEVWTLRGLVRYQVFFVMHLAKRQVEIVHLGCQVNGAVMEQVARNLTDCVDGFLRNQRFLVLDHDPLYTQAFQKILEDSGVEIIRTQVGCPQQNAYAESFVSAIRRECLDHMIFFGEKPLQRAIEQYIEHFHRERNHQGLDNLIPFPTRPLDQSESALIVKSERLGGLLKYYQRENREEEPLAA